MLAGVALSSRAPRRCMPAIPSAPAVPPAAPDADAWLFGWDPTPGIVSVWADRAGQALVWQRRGGQVRCAQERFRPWVLAASLADVAPLGPAPGPGAPDPSVTVRRL